MYHTHFQLNRPPFQLVPDPEFLFVSSQHGRAKAYMASTVDLADGFVVLTGEIGCGKTTLIESLVSELPDDLIVAQIKQTQISPVEFLQALLVELGFEPFQMRKIELLTLLKNFLLEQAANGKKILLIIDEAQNLSPEVLEEIRLLSGIDTQKEKVLRIILVGQPELAEKLSSRRLEQLTQRVRLRFHISALSDGEMRTYIQHRLDVAGAGGRSIFSDDALDLVFRYSGGVPRLINILCDTALLCAFADDEQVVGSAIVETAIGELAWVPYSDRRSQEAPTPSFRPAKRGSLESGSTGLDTPLGESRAPGDVDVSAAQAGVPLARLYILHEGEDVSSLGLPTGRITIGRTSDNDLQIGSAYMSRHHARIITSKETCILEDLNSTNGTRVAGKRIKAVRLADGDLILFGSQAVLYTDLRDTLDTAPPQPDQERRLSERRRTRRRDPRREKLIRSKVKEDEPKPWRRKRPREEARQK